MTAALTSIPMLPLLGLSDDEKRMFARLRQKMVDDRRDLVMLDDYYNGAQRMSTVGVSMPPEFEGVRAVMGWSRLPADAVHERLDIEGFRYPDAMDTDDDMWDLWQASNLDLESSIAHLDALVFGRSFVVVGTNDDGSPLITVESPLNMAAKWNPRLRHPDGAVQLYDVDKDKFAALYLPDQTITLSHETGRGWTIEDRDEHRGGWCPVMMMTNRDRAHDREGHSEITREVRSITDAGCRTLLDMEISREFYAAPQRYILGATEEAFQDAHGNAKSALETYRGRILALERDEEGNAPQVGSFAAYDPSAFTTVLNSYAEIMASITGLPPSYLGKTADQPASADAIRMQTDRLVNKVRRKQRSFEQAWEGAMRMAMGFRDGAIPDQSKRIETIWRNPEIPTPAATTDSITKQMESGYLPRTSDVAGEALGWSPLQRARIEVDRKREQGNVAVSDLVARAAAARPPAEPAGQQPTPGQEAPAVSRARTPADGDQ